MELIVAGLALVLVAVYVLRCAVSPFGRRGRGRLRWGRRMYEWARSHQDRDRGLGL